MWGINVQKDILSVNVICSLKVERAISCTLDSISLLQTFLSYTFTTSILYDVGAECCANGWMCVSLCAVLL